MTFKWFQKTTEWLQMTKNNWLNMTDWKSLADWLIGSLRKKFALPIWINQHDHQIAPGVSQMVPNDSQMVPNNSQMVPNDSPKCPRWLNGPNWYRVGAVDLWSCWCTKLISISMEGIQPGGGFCKCYIRSEPATLCVWKGGGWGGRAGNGNGGPQIQSSKFPKYLYESL